MSKDVSSSRVRALIVDSSDARALSINKALVDNDYVVIGRLSSTNVVTETVLKDEPDFLVLGMDLPDRASLTHLATLNSICPVPVIVFSEKSSTDIARQVIKVGVSSFIVDEIQAKRLPSIIDVAIERFKEQQELIQKLNAATHKLAERKLLSKAKGLLMKQKSLTEDEAYSSLRKLSMEKGQPIGKIAESIIDLFSVLET